MLTDTDVAVEATPDMPDRRESFCDVITAWVGEQRLAQAMAREELAQLEGLQRALALRNGVMLNLIRLCRINSRESCKSAVMALITFMSDNNDGLCRLSVKRMSQIFGRDARSIHTAIATLEADGLVGVNRLSGLANSYWPLIPRGMATANASVVWFADALSDAPRHGRPAAVKPLKTSVGGFPDKTPEDVCGWFSEKPLKTSAKTPEDVCHSISLIESTKGRGGPETTTASTVRTTTTTRKEPKYQELTLQPKPPHVRNTNGQREMTIALGGEAAYAELNITITASGALRISPDLRNELREVFSEEQIEHGLNRTLGAMGTDRNKLKIMSQIRRQCSYAKQDAAKYAPKSQGVMRNGRPSL